jgi:hypothetical protein
MNENHFRHIEQKYLFHAGQKEMIIDWLEHAFVHDPAFDFGAVSSIYYDTPLLSLYNEKRNGDFLKCKVRLRWYTDLQSIDQNTEVKCFLEIKRKYGAICKKQRMQLVIASRKLVDDPFSDEDILNMPSRVFEMDYLPPGILVPVLLLQYNRYRYVDSRSSSRIAVDTDIRCTRANETFFPCVIPVYLGVAVLEVKERHRSMSSDLSSISSYLTKSSFSKYAQCCEHLMQPLGRSV